MIHVPSDCHTCPRIARVASLGCFLFFFNDTATTEIYTLSLHDALPICEERPALGHGVPGHGQGNQIPTAVAVDDHLREDRKSTRLNSSHANISYAVFCLKKKTL